MTAKKNTTIELDDDFDVLDHLDGEQLETCDMPTPRVFRREMKVKMQNKLKLNEIALILPELPEKDWSFHIVANGKYDFWSFTPHIQKLIGSAGLEFYVSTWTMSRNNAVEMVKLFDDGKVGTINLLTGLYFKRRESAVYATVLSAIKKRGQRYAAFKNHAKVLLLSNGKDFIVVEGSANLTGNPRLEQYVISNHKGLYDFHAGWMMEMLDANQEKDS